MKRDRIPEGCVVPPELCLYKQIPGPPLAIMSEKLLVHILDVAEIDELVDPGQKRPEEILEQSTGLQQRLEERIMIHHTM